VNSSVTGDLNSEEWWLCIPVKKYLRKKQVKGRKFYLGLTFQSFYSRDFLGVPCAQYLSVGLFLLIYHVHTSLFVYNCP
jgi:hypothetical protein